MNTAIKLAWMTSALSAIALSPWSYQACADTSPPAAKTNFVLVMADDMGWGDVAANGSNKIVHTPNLDAMAAAGLRLTRCYATSPQCTPTRAGFLTGRHPSRNGCYCAGGNPLPTEATTMAELLRDAGYATGHFGKWHVGGVSTNDPTGPSRQGFDSQYAIINSYQVHKMDVSFTPSGSRKAERSSGYCEDVVMDAALEFIRASVEKERPFLAVIWNLAPHSPFLATEADRRPYAGLPESAAPARRVPQRRRKGRFRSDRQSLQTHHQPPGRSGTVVRRGGRPRRDERSRPHPPGNRKALARLAQTLVGVRRGRPAKARHRDRSRYPATGAA